MGTRIMNSWYSVASWANGLITDMVNTIATSKSLISLMSNGFLATIGAMANYVYVSTKKSKQMRFVPFFTAAFLGFFGGNLVGNFIPQDFAYRDGTLLVTGFCVFPILAIVEERVPAVIERMISSKIGVPPEDKR